MSASRLSHLSEPKILLVRNDGLGDFVLTLPLVASLKAQLPAARIYGLVNHRLAGLIPLLPDFEGAVLDEDLLLKRHRGAWPASEAKEKRAALQEQIRAHGFDLALLPYSESASAALVHRAGVPLRAGSLRRPYFWRFNLRNPTSRKRSRRAEYELNLTYLDLLGLKQELAMPRLRLPELQAGEGAEPASGDYVVLHPHKRSGTALTWPIARFVALAEAFMAAGLRVMVIGDDADAPVLDEHFGALLGARLMVGLDLPELMRLISRAKLFVGNSSGPLHLAGLCGTPHVGFFPQDQVSSRTRWRTLPMRVAQGAEPAQDQTAAGALIEAPWNYLLAPDLPKACVVCEGERCAYYNCVAGISPQRAREAIAGWGIVLNPLPGQPPAEAVGS